MIPTTIDAILPAGLLVASSLTDSHLRASSIVHPAGLASCLLKEMECNSTLLYEELPLHAEHSEIRVLILHPNGWHKPMLCDFKVVSLNNRPKYSALSYVWGQEDAVHEISLGGCPFWVRPNLFTALRRLRAHGGDNAVVIWVDALCIDQNSVVERNSQVAMMGEIYSRSKRVQVWLGEFELAHDIWPDNTIGTDPGRCYDIPTVNNTLGLPPSKDERGNQFFGALDGLPESETILRIALFLQFMAKRSDFRQTYLFWNPTSNGKSNGSRYCRPSLKFLVF